MTDVSFVERIFGLTVEHGPRLPPRVRSLLAVFVTVLVLLRPGVVTSLAVNWADQEARRITKSIVDPLVKNTVASGVNGRQDPVRVPAG